MISGRNGSFLMLMMLIKKLGSISPAMALLIITAKIEDHEEGHELVSLFT